MLARSAVGSTASGIIPRFGMKVLRQPVAEGLSGVWPAVDSMGDGADATVEVVSREEPVISGTSVSGSVGACVSINWSALLRRILFAKYSFSDSDKCPYESPDTLQQFVRVSGRQWSLPNPLWIRNGMPSGSSGLLAVKSRGALDAPRESAEAPCP